MTDQEKFEQWHKTHYRGLNYASHNDNYINARVDLDYDIWQAAKQDGAEEIEQLQADNLKLREALEACKHDCNTGEVIGIAAEALASTPTQSLQDHDDEVIERCAKICDWDVKQSKKAGEYLAAVGAVLLAEEIRELKGKPCPTS